MQGIVWIVEAAFAGNAVSGKVFFIRPQHGKRRDGKGLQLSIFARRKMRDFVFIPPEMCT
jgi:hypothetical protein